jgi:carbamoyl-phosphate synthase small subunit
MGQIAAFAWRIVQVFSVQYHPEASPGPQDSFYLFENFAAEMEKSRAA